jgi:small-conductance mechanosensitive channel
MIGPPDPASHLASRFTHRRDEFLTSLTNPDFYLELMLIGIALALAWFMAALIKKRIQKRLAARPPKFIDPEFILIPLQLLGPLLSLLYLSVIRPLAGSFATGSGGCVDAVIQICYAWFFAKCVILIVRTKPVAWFIAFVIMLVGVLRATKFIRSVTAYLKSIQFDVGQYQITMLNIVHGIVILVVVFWLAGLSSRTLESVLRRTSRLSYNTRELIVKFFKIFVYFTAFLITLWSLGVDLTAFAVFGGALGVGIGLGLQKLTGNFVSGVTMLMEKSIQIGDLIEVGGVTGRVRQLNIRYALITTADGRDVMIPNEELLSTRVTNWTHTNSEARIDIKVNVDYKADPAKVITTMIEAAKENSVCLKEPAPSCFLREFNDNSMQFLLTFWISDVHAGRMKPQSDVMIAVLEKFRKAGIVIPCPAAANQPGNI